METTKPSTRLGQVIMGLATLIVSVLWQRNTYRIYKARYTQGENLFRRATKQEQRSNLKYALLTGLCLGGFAAFNAKSCVDEGYTFNPKTFDFEKVEWETEDLTDEDLEIDPDFTYYAS